MKYIENCVHFILCVNPRLQGPMIELYWPNLIFRYVGNMLKKSGETPSLMKCLPPPLPCMLIYFVK